MATSATAARPYGDVTYADPKNGKYPIDTEEHARAAWSYINMPKNAAMYPLNGVALSDVKARIKAACTNFGIDVSDGDSDSGGQKYASGAFHLRQYGPAIAVAARRMQLRDLRYAGARGRSMQLRGRSMQLDSV